MCMTYACVLVFLFCVSVRVYRSCVSRVSKMTLFLCFPVCAAYCIPMLTHAYTFFDTDACAMLRNPLIEVDTRKEKAVAANWDKWSWRWSRDKLACFNVTPVKRDMEQQHQEHNPLHMTHTLWLNVTEAKLQLDSYHHVLEQYCTFRTQQISIWFRLFCRFSC